jgi:hypothetical protein
MDAHKVTVLPASFSENSDEGKTAKTASATPAESDAEIHREIFLRLLVIYRVQISSEVPFIMTVFVVLLNPFRVGQAATVSLLVPRTSLCIIMSAHHF